MIISASGDEELVWGRVKYKVRPEQSMPGKGFLHQQYQKHKEVNRALLFITITVNEINYVPMAQCIPWKKMKRAVWTCQNPWLLTKNERRNMSALAHPPGKGILTIARLCSSPEDCIALCSILHSQRHTCAGRCQLSLYTGQHLQTSFIKTTFSYNITSRQATRLNADRSVVLHLAI